MSATTGGGVVNSIEMSAGQTRWDYKTVKLRLKGFLGGKIDLPELNSALEEAGSQGWELVSVMATALYQGRTQDAVLVFKRPRPSGV